ncbi:MAG: PHP domain-containing protein [Parachlamydiales bacterium]|jgi:hypothetical protein
MCPTETDLRYDLHVHSCFSDGDVEPFELLQMAQLQGLSGLAITDHDTIAAYTPELFFTARQLGLTLILGAEISSLQGQKSVHVLAYAFEPNVIFLGFLAEIRQKRIERNLQILAKLQARGLAIAENELYPEVFSGSKGRPHIAKLLVQKGFVPNFQTAFDLYLKEGASCYVEASKFTTRQVIEEVHLAGGKAVLAHPHKLVGEKLVDNLLELPFDGLEGYSGRFNPGRRWLKIAEKKGWQVTGGSDFHSKNLLSNFLGSSWTDEKTLAWLIKK